MYFHLLIGTDIHIQLLTNTFSSKSNDKAGYIIMRVSITFRVIVLFWITSQVLLHMYADVELHSYIATYHDYAYVQLSTDQHVQCASVLQ